MRYDLEAQADAIAELAPVENGGSGQVVTLITPGEGSYDPMTDIYTPGVDLVEEGSGLVEDYSAHSIDGTVILAGDRKLLLSPVQTNGQPITAPVPDKTKVEFADGSDWLVKRCDALAPAGLTVMFTLQHRRS